jgi:hypothetical protein
VQHWINYAPQTAPWFSRPFPKWRKLINLFFRRKDLMRQKMQIPPLSLSLSLSSSLSLSLSPIPYTSSSHSLCRAGEVNFLPSRPLCQTSTSGSTIVGSNLPSLFRSSVEQGFGKKLHFYVAEEALAFFFDLSKKLRGGNFFCPIALSLYPHHGYTCYNYKRFSIPVLFLSLSLPLSLSPSIPLSLSFSLSLSLSLFPILFKYYMLMRLIYKLSRCKLCFYK